MNSVEVSQLKTWQEWLSEVPGEEAALGEAFRTGDAEAMNKFRTWLESEEERLLASTENQENQIRANIDFSLRQARIHALAGADNEEAMIDNLGNALDEATQHEFLDLIDMIKDWYSNS